MVYAFAIIMAAAAVYVGILMVRDDVAGRRDVTVSNQGGLLGGTLVVFGTVLIILVGLATLGPWREPPPTVFPVHIIDLYSPISQAERDALKQATP